MRLRKAIFNSRFLYKSFLLAGIFFFFSCKQEKPTKTTASSAPSQKLFQKIEAEQSGIHFENKLVENVGTLENLFNYDYFYNGAGVGIEDLNNDGLQDLFFCGNQQNNTLYLNKGDLTFEDVSEKAGINQGKNWSNGVTFVDINNDGWKDIYVSQGGPNKRLQRKNLLFVNQQDGSFKEMAESMGLADMGISTQSVFFDYDQDGDLDCLVMNENEYYGVDPINLYRLVEQSDEAKQFNSSRLYRNDNGTFSDVSKSAGIERPIFGLGLSVSDINNDGWLDFYIASDYYIPDALFINNQDGTFTDKIKEYTQQISFYGMGMDIADINNDQLQDIFVLDMAANDHVRSKTLMASMNTDRFSYLVDEAGFHHQYMYNSLQLNTANNSFSNIAQATTMANTDWSWSVLLSDFDQDTDRDVFITNGYRRYALDNDLQRKVYEAKVKYKGQVPLEIKKQLYDAMPSEKLPNILYQNQGNLEFKEQAKEWGLADLSFSNGAAQGDLDNDGDLDLVVNNIDEKAFLYKNLAMEQNTGGFLKVKTKGRLSESFPKITIQYQGEKQFLEGRRVRGYRSAHEDVAHFGLGTASIIDTLRVEWPNGSFEERYQIPVNSTVEFSEENATINRGTEKSSNPYFASIDTQKHALNFSHKENTYDDFEKEILLPYKQSNLGPFTAIADVNGDGKEDLYVGGASGQQGVLYIQQPNGTFYTKEISAFMNDKEYEDMEAVFFDFDNDDDLDLFVVSGGNEFAEYSSLYADRLYLNDSKGNFTKASINALNTNPKSGKSVTVIDYDRDGDQDLLVGNRIVPQNYPVHTSSTLWQNKDGSLIDVTETVFPDLLNFGIINDVIASDFDSDGWTDIVAVGEWSPIGFFRNTKGTFTKQEDPDGFFNDKGWWFSVLETDVNADGKPDYILGNAGLNIKFKASEKKAFKVYSTDFDENGTPDIVLSKKYNGEYVPVRGRECSSQQMPFIQEKFETYSEFANANLVDIYGEKLDSAYEAEVTEFHSLLLVNLGNGTFSKSKLPIETQLYPVLKGLNRDVNNDGYTDVILAGNIYETEVETPRLDALSGSILLSNGKNGYEVVSHEKSGILLRGNIKDINFMEVGEEVFLLATQNNGPLLAHQLLE